MSHQALGTPRKVSQIPPPLQDYLTSVRTHSDFQPLPDQSAMLRSTGNTDQEEEGIIRLEVLVPSCGLRLRACCLWQGNKPWLPHNGGYPGCRVSPVPASLAEGQQWFVPAQMPTSQILCTGGLCGPPFRREGKYILKEPRVGWREDSVGKALARQV